MHVHSDHMKKESLLYSQNGGRQNFVIFLCLGNLLLCRITSITNITSITSILGIARDTSKSKIIASITSIASIASIHHEHPSIANITRLMKLFLLALLLGPVVSFNSHPTSTFRRHLSVTRSLQTEETGAWIPVASTSSLADINPTSVKIFNMDYAVWRSPSGDFTVQQDACPHRLAPISQGRIDPESGCVECPYHGWQFNTSGECSKVPQMKQQESETSSVKGALSIPTLPTHVTGDLLWAFFPSSITNESFPQTTLPEDMYPVLKNTSASTSYFVRELPYSWDFLLENFMDPGHIPFAHHSLQGARTDGSPIAMEVIANNFTHCEVSFNDQIRKKPRTGVVSFQRPAYYHFRTLRGDGVWKENLKIFSVPIQHGRCRVLFESPLSNSKVPTWLVHAGSNRFLNTDSWLHDAERFSRKSAKLNYLYPTSSDLGTRTFRAWWETNGMSNGENGQ